MKKYYQKGISNMAIIGLIIAVIIVSIAAYFAVKYYSQSNSNNKTPVVIGETKEFEVEARPYSFNPSEIRVRKGDKVKIILNNIEGMHDWVLDEFNVRTNVINTGEKAEIEFIANKTGIFEYYCSVGTHRQMGMKGNLIVE